MIRKKIAIIGGGAAGMMTVATLVEKKVDAEVILIEKNAILGRKVIISGGGRCNVTTGVKSLSDVLKRYPRGEKFLKHAMHDFTPKDVFEWMEKHGVPLKIEKDLRVFPVSNDGKDVVKAFENLFENSENRVKILFKTSVKSIKKIGEKFLISIGDEEIIADKVVLTTGGQAYRQTGSTGEGYAFAEALGHKVTHLAPSLSSFMIKEDWPKKLAGVSFSNITLRLNKRDKNKFSGPMIFTHKGISGPAVFALSSLSAYEEIGRGETADLFLDFLPELSYEDLAQNLRKEMQINPKKSFSKMVGGFTIKSLANALCEEIGILPNKVNAEVGNKDLNKVIEALKNCKLTVTERTPGDEFVTAGGVDLSEVSPKTMESKICPGLFFAGEILNIDGFTGGYNLQVAWCTGRLAGKSLYC